MTTYVESAAGVGEGGRTGLTSVVVGVLFLLAVFFTPLVAIVPAYATAPALILVGFLLIAGVRAIRWDDAGTALPVFLTIIMIPFTFSISKGIGYGFISYVLLKLLTGKTREIHPLMAVVALLFVVDFYYFLKPRVRAAFRVRQRAGRRRSCRILRRSGFCRKASWRSAA